MSNQLPGFETPDSPNVDARTFADSGQAINLCILDNVPLDLPLPRLDVLIGKAFGNQVETYARLDEAKILTLAGSNPGTKSYRLWIMPDELRVLNGTYQVKVMAHGGREIYRTSLTVGYDRPQP